MLRLVQRDKGQSAKPMSMSMVAKAPHTRQGKFGATSSRERPPEVRLVTAQLHEVDATAAQGSEPPDNIFGCLLPKMARISARPKNLGPAHPLMRLIGSTR